MTERTHITTTDDLRDRDVAVNPGYGTPAVVREPVLTEFDRPSRMPSFLAGFVAALVVAAVAVVVFLAVSDSDDDGNVDVDVPAVQVETDNGG